MTKQFLGLSLAFTCSLAVAGEVNLPRQVSFAAKPTATKADGKVRITFALSGRTDVEVTVLDAKGNEVRNLAAGVLGGEKPPPEPLKAGLKQELVWDLRDNFGKPAENGPFKVRVRAGMGVKFDGFVGASPYAMGRVRGMACDAKGNLFLAEQSYDGHFPGPYSVRMYDREGNYVRTVMPWPANLKKEQVADYQPIETPAGPVPRNQYSVWPCLMPHQYAGFKMNAVLPDGRLLLGDDAFRRVFIVNADGSCVPGMYGKAVWPGKRLPRTGGSAEWAVSPDGKTLYVANWGATKPHKDFSDAKIYKIETGKLGASVDTFAEVKLPDKHPMPSGGWTADQARAALTDLAVDAAGNVYAADWVSGRVRKFDPTGKETGSVAAEKAYGVAVSPKGDAVYVLTCSNPGRKAPKKLFKFDGCGDGAKKVAELDLGGDGCAPFLALNSSGPKPQLWVACPKLLRIEDAGGELKVLEDLRERAKPSEAVRQTDKVCVDYWTDDLYVNNGWNRTVRFGGLSGKFNGRTKDGKPESMVVTDTAVSPDGHVYAQMGPKYSGPFNRFDRELKPAPVPGGASHKFGNVYGRYGAGYCEKGMCVGWDGVLYNMSMYNWARYFICAYDRSGKPVRGKRLVGQVKAKEPSGAGVTSGVIGPVHTRCGGLRVDREGCVYLGVQAFEDGHKPPAGFDGDAAYREMVGNVIKIAAGGGGLPDEKAAGRGNKSFKQYEGLLANYPDVGGFSGWRRSDCCVCRTPRFDLDPWGRLMLPNVITFQVKVVDNAGNEILRFGAYGNYDSGGAGSAVPGPEFPMAWPLSVGSSRTKIYVGDLMNQRVLRAAKTWKAEAETGIQ